VLDLCRIAAVLLATLSLSVAASAQPVFTLPTPPVTLPFLPSPSGLWTVTLGAEGQMQPDFEGAKHYLFSPAPIISIHRAGSSERFRSTRDSSGIALIDFNGFRAGPVGKFRSARTASSYADLNGLGDVKFAVELGGFAEYFPIDWFRARVEVRRGFGGESGVTADLSADAIVPLLDHFSLSGGPRFTLQSTGATAPYFSVDAAQSLASGLPSFDAKGGVHSVGAGAQLHYQFDPQWELHSYIEYNRLLGDVAASPLVTQLGSPNQITFGIGASRSFDVRMR
jgi:outer membrane protein